LKRSLAFFQLEPTFEGINRLAFLCWKAGALLWRINRSSGILCFFALVIAKWLIRNSDFHSDSASWSVNETEVYIHLSYISKSYKQKITMGRILVDNAKPRVGHVRSEDQFVPSIGPLKFLDVKEKVLAEKLQPFLQ